MGPKKGQKKGKANKAEKAKVLKEEQKRREEEEEEFRLQREQEERERLEREKKRQEKQEWLEQKDRERRGDELSELSQTLEDNYFAVTKWQAETKEKEKWERYMSCDGSPNPSIPQEVNAFINLWREDPEIQISPVLKDIAQALRLIEELECVPNNRGDSEQDEKDAQQEKETLLSLRNLVNLKLNLASEEILKWSSTNADMETGNMQKIIQDNNITLCLWANLSKNARLKEVRFEEVGLGFELPKQLAVSDIAVRVLHTRYDHLSPLSREVQRKQSAALVEEASTVAELEQAEQGEEEEGMENGEADVQLDKPSSRKSSVSLASVKERRKSTASQEPTAEEGENGTEGPPDELAAAVEEDPASISLEPVPSTPEVDFVDLHQYMSLGGVFYFEAFHMPPQSHVIKGWEMRKILDAGLQAFPYPTDQAQIQSSITKKEEPSSSPVGITMTLPHSVIFLEDPIVACWDPTALQWRRDGAYETTYDASARTISFKMDSFCTFALLQDSYANVPFQSWELRPLGKNSALLTINAGLTEVRITIKDSKCMLTSDQRSELSHVSGKWMSVSSFQEALTSSGINIFVNEHSSKYVSITAKDPLTEQAVYEQMALMASTVAFSWSRWNSHCGQEHMILQACQHMEAEPVPEEAWSLFLLGAQRSQCLEMKEWSESFSLELADDSEFHSTFLHMLKDSMTLAGWQRVQETHHLFIDCVHSLLCATRVLTYS